MKRMLVLIMFPLSLVVVAVLSGAFSQRFDAAVTLKSDDIRASRNIVIARLSELGASIRAEDTRGADASEVIFQVPAAQLNAVLDTLNAVGDVTSTEVDLSGSFDDAPSVASGLAELDGCIDRVSNQLGENAVTSARSSLDECRARLDRTIAKADAEPHSAEPVRLAVRFTANGSSWWTVAVATAIAFLLLVVAGAAFVFARRQRADDIVVLPRDDEPHRITDRSHERSPGHGHWN